MPRPKKLTQDNSVSEQPIVEEVAEKKVVKKIAKAKVKVLHLMVNPNVDMDAEILDSAISKSNKRLPVQSLYSEALNKVGNIWKPGEEHILDLDVAKRLAEKTIKKPNPLFGEIKPGTTHNLGADIRPTTSYVEILEEL